MNMNTQVGEGSWLLKEYIKKYLQHWRNYNNRKDKRPQKKARNNELSKYYLIFWYFYLEAMRKTYHIYFFKMRKIVLLILMKNLVSKYYLIFWYSCPEAMRKTYHIYFFKMRKITHKKILILIKNLITIILVF